MPGTDPKAELRRYLQIAREALLWKLDGLSDYDVRRPLVPTGTNLLGLVKHVASTEAGYLGDTFGRPFPEPFPWFGAGRRAERRHVGDGRGVAPGRRRPVPPCLGPFRRHARGQPLDAVGHVPWWPDERSEVTLQTIVVHMIAETNRHAGHADVVRELVDGTVGLRADNGNLPERDEAWWSAYRQRLEDVARTAGRG